MTYDSMLDSDGIVRVRQPDNRYDERNTEGVLTERWLQVDEMRADAVRMIAQMQAEMDAIEVQLTMIWDFEGGGGLSPNNAVNKPGEEFGFNWSLYRDVLTMTTKEGMISPLPDGRKWKFQQVGATPDASALNQQCPPPTEAFPDTPH